jgi:3-oxoacyl-[acyl-carrier protein] reductase
MNLGLKGKAALITGASRGIGAAIARELLQEGARGFLVARNHETLTKTASTLVQDLTQVRTFAADLTNSAECEAAISAAIGAFGALDNRRRNAA